MTLLLPL